ncbi:MAG: hypothetical protein WC886_07535 [Saccharofermentanaceae bacterium]
MSEIKQEIDSNNPFPKPPIKILTAAEANEITLIKEPEVIRGNLEYEESMFMEIMKGIREASECGLRDYSLYYFCGSSNFEAIKKRLLELGYSFAGGTHNSKRTPDMFVTW